MEELKIISVIVENYRKLQSANVFIKFNATIECETKVNIILKNNKIIIEINSEQYDIETSEFFFINVKSCYNLIVKGSFISFRIITTDDDEKFNSEIITTNNEAIKYENLKLSIDENQDIKISCSNCEQPLMLEKQINFKRVLSLPSSSMSLTDWFCHRHTKVFPPNQDNDDSALEEENSQCFNEDTGIFEPKLGDIFYGNFHILLNSRNFEMNRFRQKNSSNEFHCKRCLQLICRRIDKTRSLFFWYENIKFNGNLLYCDLSPIDLIKKVICNHVAHNPIPIVKIIFESFIPKTTQRVYILLQIMDKNMKILKLNLDNYKLTEHKTIKVIFLKLTQEVRDDDSERTLKYWQKDLSIINFEISFNLFHTFCEYLQSKSNLIPESFVRLENLFQISYIFLDA